MYCPHQYLSIDPTKVDHAHSNAHKLQEIVNMNADLSETVKDRELGLKIKILLPCTQCKFVTRISHAQSNANKPPNPMAPTIFKLEKIF